MVWDLCSMDSSNITKEFSEKRKRKIPLGTKGRTSILSYREYVRPAGLHSPSAEKTARPRMFRHFVPSRELHSLATLVRLSLVDLPSANGFDKPFAASKFELYAENNPPYDCRHTEDSLFYEHCPMQRVFFADCGTNAYCKDGGHLCSPLIS